MNLGLLICALVLTVEVAARPPEDTVDFSSLEGATRKRKKVLLDKDITFTEEDIEKKFEDPLTMRVRYEVLGRSLPDRKGQALEKFPKGSFVKVEKLSKDGRWVAVESIKSGKKRWLPRAALPIFKEDLLKQKKSADGA